MDVLTALRKAWCLRLGVFGCAVILCIVLAAVSAPYIRVILILASTGMVVRGVKEWRRGPYRTSRIYTWLVDTPESIVWVYGLQLLRAPLGVYIGSRHRITFVSEDGASADISLPSHRYLVVMKWLNRVLPRAEFGWSQERADRWSGL